MNLHADYKEAVAQNRKKVGSLIKKLREDNGASLQDVASETGLTVQTVEKIENGEAEHVSIATLSIISRYFDRSVYVFPTQPTGQEFNRLGKSKAEDLDGLKDLLDAMIQKMPENEARAARQAGAEEAALIQYSNQLYKVRKSSAISLSDAAQHTGLSEEWLKAAHILDLPPADLSIDTLTAYSHAFGKECHFAII